MSTWETRWSHERWLAVGMLVLAGLVVMACGRSPGSGPDRVASEASGTSDITIVSEGPPRRGGSITYGIEAETSGYNPTNDRFAVAGTQIGLAIFDPLAAFDRDGNAQPYLAESITPSDDFRTWTITARPGIRFHNGTPLDGAAMKAHFDAARASLLVGLTFQNVEDVALHPTDPLAIVITTTSPWATFPVYLTGQIGMIAAPEQVGAAPGEPGSDPIGTGPFIFVSHVFDKEVVTRRNPDYWQRDEHGQPLPYLDAVTFQIVPVRASRAASMSGANPLTMAHFGDANSLSLLQGRAEAGRLQMAFEVGESEEDVLLLNTAAEPFDNLTARQAVATATDLEQYNEIMNGGRFEQADSPFRPSSKWYAKTPYPVYDPVRAAALVEQYTAETGKPLAFTLHNSGSNKDGIETLQEQYRSVGMQVHVDLIPQDQFVTNAAFGNFQALEWRQFGALDPDYEYLWWSGENAAEIGRIGSNFSRHRDAVLDQALRDGRASTDFATRKAAYDTVQARLNAELPYIWLDHAQWAIVAQNDVRDLTNGPLPDGQEAWPIGGPGGFGGSVFLTRTWLD